MSDIKELFKKYNVPGPRYTSYPTVPYWDQTPTESQWIENISQALTESEKVGVGAAIYVHIPFCKSLCTYCGCNTRITRNTKVGHPYVQTLIKEWGLYLSRLNKKVAVSEIHLGGGTPTFLSPDELQELIQGLLSQVTVTSDHEFSFEADPRVTGEAHLRVLREMGFTRLSLGIQDFDPKVQEIVHRVQSEEEVRTVTETARSLGYSSVNYDLIYGLPLQTRESVRNTIEVVRRLRPDRIAFYGYAHVPWIKPGQRRFTEADLPSGDEKRALYELGRELLESAGYREVGMDHFALETDPLWIAHNKKTLHRNFMGYTSRLVAPLIPLGVSAIGDSWRSFGQNEKLLETYQRRVEAGEIPIFRGHVLSEEDLILRRHILNLMTRMETGWHSSGSSGALSGGATSTDGPTGLVAGLTTGLNTPYLETIGNRLTELEKDGLIEVSGDSCKITEQGRPFIRNICMAFDARLMAKSPTTQLFSRTI